MSKRLPHFPKRVYGWTRSAALLLPIFSVPHSAPGNFYAAGKLLPFFKKSGLRWWKVLPLTIPDNTGSPYASPSGFALNWNFISSEILLQQGWLTAEEVNTRRPRRTASRQMWDRYWRRLLWQAGEHFQAQATDADRRSLQAFTKREKYWLDDFSLFAALKDRFAQQPWWEWPAAYRSVERAREHTDERLKRRQEWHIFIQWVAREQWDALHRAANQAGVTFIGDLPFFVRTDSADVWANQKLFALNAGGTVDVGAGAPPDGFARGGQWWGNPQYNWSAHRRQGFQWWKKRLAYQHQLYDALRLDHYQGFFRTWAIPGRTKEPKHGHWMMTPPELRSLLRLTKRPMIAEDLGSWYPPMNTTRKKQGLLGTRLWEFGWSGYSDTPHRPDHIAPDTIYCSSNHDQVPVRGWWRITKASELHHARIWYKVSSFPQEKILKTIAYSSAVLAVYTIQDLRGYGVTGAINRPGGQRGHWCWQAKREDFTAAEAVTLRRLLEKSQRV